MFLDWRFDFYLGSQFACLLAPCPGLDGGPDNLVYLLLSFPQFLHLAPIPLTMVYSQLQLDGVKEQSAS